MRADEPRDEPKAGEELAPRERPGEESIEGELVKDPKVLRTIEFYVQQNIQHHLHLGERGFLPDAEELARFEQVKPGLAGEIIEQWKTESGFRRDMDREIVRAQITGYNRYQNYIFLLLVLLIAGGVVLAALGVDVLGWLLALAGIVPIIVRALLGVLGRNGEEEPEQPEAEDISHPPTS